MPEQQLQIIGFIGNIFLALAYFPQIIKIIRTKKAEDISIWMWICYLFGDASAFIYATLTKDTVFISLFAFFTICNFILIYLTVKYGKKAAKDLSSQQ